MPEYDPNLPQEFTRMPKRSGATGVFIAVGLAAALGVLTFLALSRSQAPIGDNTAANQHNQQDTASDAAQRVRSE